MGENRSRIIHAWRNLERPRKAELAMFFLFLGWLIMVLMAPLILPSGSVSDLSGTVGAIDNADQIEKMNPMAQLVYVIGDMNCHQLSERSLFLNDNQMPFCSRDVGIFLGLVIGLALIIPTQAQIPLVGFAISLVPLALDGSTQLVLGYESTNFVRILTGVLAGIGVGMILSRLARSRMSIPYPSREMDV